MCYNFAEKKETAFIMSRIGILNFPGHLNHGANLTAYALQKVLLGWGHDVENLHLCCNYKLYKDKRFTAFSDQHIRLTRRVSAGLKSMQMYNEDFDTFIVGSDQVWRCSDKEDSWMRPWEDCYRLAFAAPGKRRIAMAASFGRSDFTADEHVRESFCQELRRYSGISVRERSGVDILASLGAFSVQLVIDPVFYLEAGEWQSLADHQGRQFAAAATIVYNSFFFGNFVSEFAEHYHDKYEMHDVCSGSTAQWLAAIQDAKFVITDSYHVCCFCLIFGTPFVCLSSQSRGIARFYELAETFGFSRERVVDVDSTVSVSSAIYKVMQMSLNVQSIRSAVEKGRNLALQWLKRALAAPVPEWSGPPFAYASKQEVKDELHSCRVINLMRFSQSRIRLLNVLLHISPVFREKLRNNKLKHEQLLNSYAW